MSKTHTIQKKKKNNLIKMKNNILNCFQKNCVVYDLFLLES